jgi:hypothetical protein
MVSGKLNSLKPVRKKIAIVGDALVVPAGTEIVTLSSEYEDMPKE